MNIIDDREPIREGVRFSDLAIGQVYMDTNGGICIKTRDTDGGSGGANNCIFCEDGKWEAGREDASNFVEPLKADLVLKGRDTQYD